ncbi:MAG TPA: phosphate ABC transporter permease subunit PstC [Actinomycetota bacterium]|jgi:phosphate transport system permease protein|nr:phosphate ABC transporter permease subunit PstC [Actinomycetota bacterium]
MGAVRSLTLTSNRRRVGERLIIGALLACGAISVATTLAIIASLAVETVDFFQEVPFAEYFTGTTWAPTFSPPHFGVLPLVSATLLITAIAALVAFPLGLGTAIYLSEYAKPRVRKTVKPFLEVLAGIPTVALGYFALTFVTPTLAQRLVPGTRIFNALSAGVVVGVMIIPLVASISEDAMRAVPRSLREAAYGMGATRRTVATRVVVPGALSGIAASFILGLSRAIGETMIVAIAAGALPNLSIDPRESMETMTTFIVQVSLGDTPAGSTAYKTIFAVGTTLFAMTLVLNILSHQFVRRFRERYE